MDHVRLPKDPAGPSIQVPYLCAEEYPGVSFHVYPAFKKWTLADIFYRPQWTREAPFGDDQTFDRRPIAEATSFLQSWLFFGLVTTILGPNVSVQDFIAQNASGTAVITTRKLPEYIRALEERDKDVIEVQMAFRRDNADQCITTAHKVYSYVADNTTVDPAVMLSIAALGDYLTMVRNTLYCDDPRRLLSIDWMGPSSSKGLAGDIIGARMIRDGWCKSQVRRALRLSPSGRYSLAHLARPDPQITHDGCSFWQCKAYEMHWETYETVHVLESCSCPFIYARSDQLHAILLAGKIPVISSTCSFEPGLPIEIREAGTKSKYVAISHVWSDGLGNSFHNALPQCQLKRISHLVQQLYPAGERDLSFWIDTICCPREPMEARRLAITVMSHTYNGADKVLVLDKYLQSAPAHSMSEFERMARLYVSGWLTRMWTLQEGVLSKMLFIQYADISVEFTEALCKTMSRRTEPEFHKLREFLMRIRGLWVWTRTPEPFSSLHSLIEVLYDRSTSVPTDEAICLSILTNTDMDRLMKVPPEERMKEFWFLQKTYTGDLIFWTGRRLKDQGYRWAPASFMNQHLEYLPGNGESSVRNPASRTSSGLSVRYSGIIIGPLGNYPAAKQFWLRDENKDWKYWMKARPSRDEDHDLEGAVIFDPSMHSQTTDIALILRSPAQSLEDNFAETPSVDVAMVSIYKREGAVLFAHLETTGTLHLAAPGLMPKDHLAHALFVKGGMLAIRERQGGENNDDGWRVNDTILEDRHHGFDGDWVGEEQEWCID